MLLVILHPKIVCLCLLELYAGPPEPNVLSRDELVQQLGGVALAGGEFGSHVPGGMLVMETSDSLGCALGGVQKLTTEGGMLEGKIAPRSLLVTPSGSSSSHTAGSRLNSPASSCVVEELGTESDLEIA